MGERWRTNIYPQPVANSAVGFPRSPHKLTTSVTKCPVWTALNTALMVTSLKPHRQVGQMAAGFRDERHNSCTHGYEGIHSAAVVAHNLLDSAASFLVVPDQ